MKIVCSYLSHLYFFIFVFSKLHGQPSMQTLGLIQLAQLAIRSPRIQCKALQIIYVCQNAKYSIDIFSFVVNEFHKLFVI